jgi:hypothetical protein
MLAMIRVGAGKVDHEAIGRMRAHAPSRAAHAPNVTAIRESSPPLASLPAIPQVRQTIFRTASAFPERRLVDSPAWPMPTATFVVGPAHPHGSGKTRLVRCALMPPFVGAGRHPWRKEVGLSGSPAHVAAIEEGWSA